MFDKAEYIYEIYKTGSFSKAAKNLYISQPALSACVNKIEKDMNCQLFDRSTHPISLTEVGRIYVETYEKMSTLEKDYYNKLNEINNLQSGHLTVAGANFFSSYMLPPIMKSYSKSYPAILFNIVESDSIALYDMALDKSIDLILDAGAYNEDLFTAHPIMTEQILLAVPRQDSINQLLSKYKFSYQDIMEMKHKNSDLYVPISAFQEFPFILLKKGHDMNTRSMLICQQHGFTPTHAVYLNQLATAYNLARHDLGVVFVTDTLVQLAPPADNLIFYVLEGPAAFREIFLAHKKNITLTKTMEAYIATARKVFHDPV